MSRWTIVAIVVPISVAVLIFIVGICYFNKRTRKKYDSDSEGISELGIGNLESLRYDFRTIKAATNDFSTNNKIAEGAFRRVYKGRLANGQEIAVKRLLRTPLRPEEGFYDVVEVLAKVQHRNLVRFLGFCAQREEKILVYEYWTNKSLNYILFDPEKREQLNWATRHKIIKGIARGIQYLHEDSRLKIISRNIKPSNILLDDDMNPKITDFGLARALENGHVTRPIYYLDPAHFRTKDYSAETDVYRFGTLLIDIISGRQIGSLYQMREDEGECMFSRVWRLWENGQVLELLDPTIKESCNPIEVMRCIHIALLCLHLNPLDRPSMSSILIMLESYTLTLPSPSKELNFDRKAKEIEQYRFSISSVEPV